MRVIPHRAEVGENAAKPAGKPAGISHAIFGFEFADELEPLAGGAEDALPGGLWDAVLHLPEEQRAAVTLYYYEDLPVAEIARVLGVAQGTVKSRLGRARQRLKEQLQEEDKI